MIKRRITQIRRAISKLLSFPVYEYNGLKAEINNLAEELKDIEKRKTASFHALSEVTEQFVRVNQKHYADIQHILESKETHEVMIDEQIKRTINLTMDLRKN